MEVIREPIGYLVAPAVIRVPHHVDLENRRRRHRMTFGGTLLAGPVVEHQVSGRPRRWFKALTARSRILDPLDDRIVAWRGSVEPRVTCIDAVLHLDIQFQSRGQLGPAVLLSRRQLHSNESTAVTATEFSQRCSNFPIHVAASPGALADQYDRA